jgi:hypothetical protein
MLNTGLKPTSSECKSKCPTAVIGHECGVHARVTSSVVKVDAETEY